MTVYVCDPGLDTYRGHHATVSGGLAAALRAAGQDVRLLAYGGGEPAVLAEVGAQPHFAFYAYDTASDDPVCGWMETLFVASAAYSGGLARLGLTADDVVIWSSMTSAQALASASLPCPVVGVLGYPCRPGAEATAWRFVARRAPALRYAATAPLHAEVYRQALGADVALVANPHHGPLRRRYRCGVLGVLGHQRPAKGFHLIPAVAHRLGDAVRWLIHDSGDDMPEVHEALAALGLSTNRGEVREFGGLLDACDALLLPYARRFYGDTHSGLVAEAMACGLPIIVPDGTALHVQAAGYGGLVTYLGDDAEGVVEGVRILQHDFEHLAEAAHRDALVYRERNGSAAFARDLLALVTGGAADGQG